MNRYPEPIRMSERVHDAAPTWLVCAVLIIALSMAGVLWGGWAGLVVLLSGVLGGILGVCNLMLELGNQGYVFKRGLDQEGHHCWKIGMRSGGGVIWL